MTVRIDRDTSARASYLLRPDGTEVDPAASAGPGLIFVPTLDTAAYAAGDVAWDFALIDGVFSAASRPSMLQTMSWADKADIGPDLTIYFAKASASLGTVNAAPSISDADSFKLIGAPLLIAAADWTDLGGNRYGGRDNIGKLLFASAGTGVYCAGRFTPAGTAGTFGASDIQLTMSFLQG